MFLNIQGVFVAGPVGVMQEFRGLGVVHALLDDGVPDYGTAQFHGNVAQVAHGAGAVTHLDGNVGVAAAQDGIDELAVVAHFYLVGDVAGFLDGHVELLVGGLELAAAHFDPAFRAVNLHAGRAAVEGLFREDDAVVVLEKEDLRKIAETKMKDLNCTDIEAAMSMIAGTCRSMGVLIGD